MSILQKILSFFKNGSKPKAFKGHVAICVGHSRIGDYGAYSVGNVSEWDYNIHVANALKKILESHQIKATVISEYPRKTYKGAMNWLATMLATLNCDCAVELHFNSATPQAHGYEYLYLKGSQKGKRLAGFLLEAHMSVIGNKQKCRGTTTVKVGGRGYGFLSKVSPPAVICEPFFGSNSKEWKLYDYQPTILANIYADGILSYLNE